MQVFLFHCTTKISPTYLPRCALMCTRLIFFLRLSLFFQLRSQCKQQWNELSLLKADSPLRPLPLSSADENSRLGGMRPIVRLWSKARKSVHWELRDERSSRITLWSDWCWTNQTEQWRWKNEASRLIMNAISLCSPSALLLFTHLLTSVVARNNTQF